jgi:hypothetical protein
MVIVPRHKNKAEISSAARRPLAIAPFMTLPFRARVLAGKKDSGGRHFLASAAPKAKRSDRTLRKRHALTDRLPS